MPTIKTDNPDEITWTPVKDLLDDFYDELRCSMAKEVTPEGEIIAPRDNIFKNE